MKLKLPLLIASYLGLDPVESKRSRVFDSSYYYSCLHSRSRSIFWGCKILISPKSNQFAQIQSLLPNFSSIMPKFRLNFAQVSSKSKQICPNLINFARKTFAKDAAASPATTALVAYHSLREGSQFIIRQKEKLQI